jgi:hypothetical protein
VSRIKRTLAAMLLVLFMGTVAGCTADLGSLLQIAKSPATPLIRVHIQFTDQKEAVCYVKNLGLEKDAPVYTGGPSSNNMYDRDGNVVGTYNYQHVINMTILSEEGSSQP